MAEFKLPDPKGKAGNTLGIIAGLALLGAGYLYLLPFLLTIVWGTTELLIGTFCAVVLGYIFFSKKFWRRCKIILDTLGEILFRGFLEMNPFTILRLQVEEKERDIEQLKIQAEKLRGEETKLALELNNKKNIMLEAKEQIEIVQSKLKKYPNDEELQIQLETSANTFTNAKDYVDSVTPIYHGIAELGEFGNKAYRKSKALLANAKNTIEIRKQTYDAVTAGDNAMKKAWRAFTGDSEMNKSAEIALEKLRKDIGEKMGSIKQSIELTTRVMNEKDLRDAAKMSLAVKESKKLDVQLDSIPVGPIPVPVSLPASRGNKYL
jgi:hypothetical protein